MQSLRLVLYSQETPIWTVPLIYPPPPPQCNVWRINEPISPSHVPGNDGGKLGAMSRCLSSPWILVGSHHLPPLLTALRLPTEEPFLPSISLCGEGCCRAVSWHTSLWASRSVQQWDRTPSEPVRCLPRDLTKLDRGTTVKNVFHYK